MPKSTDRIKGGQKQDVHQRGLLEVAKNGVKKNPSAHVKAAQDFLPVSVGPRVQEAMIAITEVLSDGQEHSVKDIKSVIKGLGSRERYIYDALKIMPEVVVHNHGRGGSFWKLRNPEIPNEEKRQNNPSVARDTQIAKKKDDKRSPRHAAIRDRVEEVIPGYDPVVSIAEIANDPTIPIAIRLECHRDVARYTTPQVKATEITSDDQPIALNFKWEA